MKKLILLIAVVLVVGFTVTSCKSDAEKEVEEVKTEIKEVVKEVVKETKSEEIAMATYQCPMKCEGDKTYDKPGQCPTCKMDLAEVKAEAEEQEQEGESEEQEG